MRKKTIPTEEEERKMFENFISKDLSPGKTNRILLTEDVIFEHPRKQEEIDKKKLKNLILSYL